MDYKTMAVGLQNPMYAGNGPYLHPEQIQQLQMLQQQYNLSPMQMKELIGRVMGEQK